MGQQPKRDERLVRSTSRRKSKPNRSAGTGERLPAFTDSQLEGLAALIQRSRLQRAQAQTERRAVRRSAARPVTTARSRSGSTTWSLPGPSVDERGARDARSDEPGYPEITGRGATTQPGPAAVDATGGKVTRW